MIDLKDKYQNVNIKPCPFCGNDEDKAGFYIGAMSALSSGIYCEECKAKFEINHWNENKEEMKEIDSMIKYFKIDGISAIHVFFARIAIDKWNKRV